MLQLCGAHVLMPQLLIHRMQKSHTGLASHRAILPHRRGEEMLSCYQLFALSLNSTVSVVGLPRRKPPRIPSRQHWRLGASAGFRRISGGSAVPSVDDILGIGFCCCLPETPSLPQLYEQIAGKEIFNHRAR